MDDITVLIPTSPTPIHPSTRHFDETLQSVRERLPNSKVTVMCDGVRKEQHYLQHKYEEYIHKIRRYESIDALMIVTEHNHQAQLTRKVLEDPWTVETPLILFVEHDCPLVGDIDFDSCADAIRSGEANVIRFHHEAQIPAEHMYLMPDDGHAYWLSGAPLTRTIQWSQRPHLASAEYYRRILTQHFKPDENWFIEDRMHGIVQSEPWERNKLWIYHPQGNIKRSAHLDSRGDEPKWVDS